MTTRHCLTLDLKDDPALIAEYQRYHQNVWPDIKQSIRSAGIHDMEIYLLGTRMFMIIEVDDSFSFAKKAELDHNNHKVQEWETLMWKFQQPLKESRPGEKWLLMQRIFKLSS